MKETARYLRLGSVILVLLTYLGVFSVDADPPQAKYLLAKLQAGALADVSSMLSGLRIEGWTPLNVPGWIRIAVPEQQLAHTQAALERAPGVLVVEEDRYVRATLTPNDTYWSSQWGPAIVNAPGAWDITTSNASVVVAVLDSGIEVGHSDLLGQVWVNPGEIPGNGVDDDSNGKVDDINGWRFLLSGESGNVDDDFGHGTHVAGIVAARGNNAQGIAGMAWGCRLMIVKVLDSSGNGRYSDVADGLIYAVDNGAQVVNLSLGGPDNLQVLGDAVDYAYAQGVLVIAAAGNASYGTYDVLYPAAYTNALAIAASDSSDQRASYSRYGPEVDLTAPGSSIYSTCVGDSYCYKTGTSMATPHVSGLAALIWSYQPTYTMTQVSQVMIDTAYDIGDTGWDQYTGWGRIDAYRALVSTMPYVLYIPLFIQCAGCPWLWPLGQ